MSSVIFFNSFGGSWAQNTKRRKVLIIFTLLLNVQWILIWLKCEIIYRFLFSVVSNEIDFVGTIKPNTTENNTRFRVNAARNRFTINDTNEKSSFFYFYYCHLNWWRRVISALSAFHCFSLLRLRYFRSCEKHSFFSSIDWCFSVIKWHWSHSFDVVIVGISCCSSLWCWRLQNYVLIIKSNNTHINATFLDGFCLARVCVLISLCWRHSKETRKSFVQP